MSDNENKQLRGLRAKVEQEKKDAFRAALTLAERAAADQDVGGELEFALQRVETLDRRLASLPEVEVVREPDIYDPFGPNSFFRDLIASVSPEPVPGTDHQRANERLARHQAHESKRLQDESRVAAARAAVYGVRGASDGHSRALASDLTGSGGAFAPPKWLLDDFSSVARAACPLRALVKRAPLPPDGAVMNIPRATAVGGVVAPNASENIVPPQTVSATDSISANVATFAGEIVASQQLYERGPAFDQLMAMDFGESYAASLANELMNGPGTTGRMLGLLNVSSSTVDGVPGAQIVTWTTTNPTPWDMSLQAANLAALIADTRERPPSACLMRPSRWEWFAGFNAGGSEPVIRPGTGHIPDDPDVGPYGPLPGGLPVYLDATIPTNLGAGTNQDAIVQVRAKDIILLEDQPRFQALVDNVGGQLSVVLTYHTYAAAFTTRYPSGVGVVTGSGLVTPAGW